jgi:hypothetical protein
VAADSGTGPGGGDPPARGQSAAGALAIPVNGLDFAGHTRAMCATPIPVLAQDHASRPGGLPLRRRRAAYWFAHRRWREIYRTLAAAGS